jgi:hypothetical protein
MVRVTAVEEQVWSLHLALRAAAAGGPVYAPTTEDEGAIRSYTESGEAELALVLVLAVATPDIPAALRELAGRVAALVWPREPADRARVDVDAWLRWSLASGEEPPYTT